MTATSNLISISNTTSPGYINPAALTPLTIGKAYTTNSTGAFLTTGSNGTSWANEYDTVLKVNQSPPELEVKGRLVLNGRDLEERLDIIERVLQIPERDAILERKHPKLKKLYDEYIAALAKYRTFDTIKESK